MGPPHRTIVHLDADCFFAAVEQASDPKLRGRPIAVGGEKRGIIASASYEARKFGVFTPMPTVSARKLCPKLIVIPGDFERYEQFSLWMFGYCYDFTPEVEQTSIDEGYFDLTGNREKAPLDIARTIRDAIQKRLKITVSEGIASNKLVSAVASKLRKPAAFEEVPTGTEAEFLRPLPNKWLPGIGPKTSARLDAAGLREVGQIAGTPLEMLELLLGNQARVTRQFARGVDERPLVPASEPQKSFSEQMTFGTDLTDEEYIEAVLMRMADNLFARVREDSASVRTLTVRVRYNDMAEDQVCESLWEPTNLETDVYGRLRSMLRRAWKRRVSLRLVSLKLSNIYPGIFRNELALESSALREEATRKLSQVIDGLRKSRGRSIILRGHDFRLRERPRDALAASAPAERRLTIRVAVSPSAAYVPLRVRSHYSFLDSTLSPSAIVTQAAAFGMKAVALTDLANLHGAVPFVQAAKAAGVTPILGTELTLDGHTLLLYVESRSGYENLCRLLSRHLTTTAGNGQGDAVATQERRPLRRLDLEGLTGGLIAVSSDPGLAPLFPKSFYHLVSSTSPAGAFPAVACPAVCYETPDDRQKYEILQSIRTLSLLQEKHPEKRQGGRFHLRSPVELSAACREHPEWMARTQEIAERCRFEFPFGKPQFPEFVPPDGSSPRSFLRKLVQSGLERRYREKASKHAAQVEEELRIISAVGYEGYFLLTWELLEECRRQGIPWITRGSAADSLVCYCLGISDVCPIRFDLYFKRFLNPERMALNKLPDIDVDFPHDRKDDVVRLLFSRHGLNHCAVVGGFSTFQARSAFGEVAKVLGLSEREVRRFTEHFPWGFGGGWVPDEPAPKGGAALVELLREKPETRHLPFTEEPYRTALEMAVFLDGAPRYPKMHPCGVVLSRQPMHELTPTFISSKGLPTTHFDMDAVEEVGLVKMDILAQGGLSVMRDATANLQKRGVTVNLGGLEPWDDPEVWQMIASGGARAVHHIESPAMTTLHRMTNVREIDGLIAIVSVIRPGAANESKKLSFTRRYQGMEPVTYPDPSLEACLRSTYGLVVYEEHILQISEAFAGLTAGRADVLRRALVKQKRAVVGEIGKEFAASARQRGHSEARIAEVWELVTGFSGYAFNKAHSTAYGVEAYQAAWLKRYHPAEFMAGVLTHGKGFYHPLVYVLECHRLGLRLLPPSINQPGPAFVPCGETIRVPVTGMKGLTEKTRERLLAEVSSRHFTSLGDFYARVAPSGEEFEAMIRLGAFDEFRESRSRQFWQAQHLVRTFSGSGPSSQGWLLPPPSIKQPASLTLSEPSPRERLLIETDLLGFTVSGHPLELWNDIAWDTYCPVKRLGEYVGQTVVTCGLVVEQRTHHQVTGEAMKFLSIADWGGIVETELFAQTYRTYGLATVRYPVVELEARVEPFENGRGFSLRVLRAGEPRKISSAASERLSRARKNELLTKHSRVDVAAAGTKTHPDGDGHHTHRPATCPDLAWAADPLPAASAV